MDNYNHIFTYNNNKEFNINQINEYIKNNPNHKVLVKLNNTVGISSEMINKISKNIDIRIAGAFDDTRINNYKKARFYNEEHTKYVTCQEAYYNSVIYSRNETILILKEIEKIESKLKKEFSDIQKLMYIYVKLKRTIMYDPKFEEKTHKEIRSLRPLITKEGVCAGYSLILKEMLDRQGIECHYIKGLKHAWNIVNIEGNLYQLDLTKENAKYRNSGEETFDFFCQNKEKLNEKNIPDEREPIKNYQQNLSELDIDFIKELYIKTIQEVDFSKTSYKLINNNKEEYILSQIGKKKINNIDYYLYYYVRKINDNLSNKPLILVSKVNICGIVDAIEFKRKEKNYEEENAIVNMLFSKENITDSLNKKTCYIGELKKDRNDNIIIHKNNNDCSKFTKPAKVYPRTDGSMFVLEETDINLKINNIITYKYNLYEYIKFNNKYILKKNIIYSEKNLINDDRNIIPDYLLTRKRIDDKSKSKCGYVGYIDEKEKIKYTDELVSFFDNSRLTIEEYKERKKEKITIPDYYEYRKLSDKYELINDKFSSIDEVLVVDKKTKEINKDQNTNIKAYFSLLVKRSLDINENDPNYKKIYDYICNLFRTEVQEKKYIDTINIYNNFKNSSFYQDFFLKLFKTDEQTRFINELFIKAINKNNLILIEPTKLEKIDSTNKLIN